MAGEVGFPWLWSSGFLRILLFPCSTHHRTMLKDAGLWSGEVWDKGLILDQRYFFFLFLLTGIPKHVCAYRKCYE